MLCARGGGIRIAVLNLYAVAQMFAGPRAAGSWIGFQNAVGNFSGILRPVIAGILIDSTGYASAFYLAAAITAFGGIWWVVGVPRIQQVNVDAILTLTASRDFLACPILNQGESDGAQSTIFFVVR